MYALPLDKVDRKYFSPIAYHEMGVLKITVKTLQQKQFKLEVDSTDTILSVKEKIEQSQGHPVAQQKLIFSGNILSDDKKVEENNITEKDFLDMMVSIPKAAIGPEMKGVLENFISTGFTRAESELAFRASFNNPDRAVEYLFNGISENILNEMNAAQQQDTNISISPGTTTVPANDADELMSLTQLVELLAQQPLGAGSASLKNTPQLQQLRQLAQTNPGLVQPFFRQLAQGNPILLQALTADSDLLLQALHEEQSIPGGVQLISVTEDERLEIESLEALGFPRQVVIEAYFACDKNEELAANYLFDHGNDDFE
ncbi:Putative UV excision repair protein Rad23 [Rhizopus microsporus]|nr:Putative UV excision repair protein Rad23 [Rhizopus microsporus]